MLTEQEHLQIRTSLGRLRSMVSVGNEPLVFLEDVLEILATYARRDAAGAPKQEAY